MITVDLIQPNRYQDSVTLMQVAGQVRALPGIADAALMMGTDPNKEMLRDADLLTDEGAAAGPNDLIIALHGTEEGVESAREQINDLLRVEAPAGGTRERE